MKNILIVRVSAIGDVIHTLPAVILLKASHPEIVVHWAVQKKAAALLQDQPFVDKIWILPDHYCSLKNIPATLKIIKQLKLITWDAILDFQGLLKTSLLYLSLSGKKYGFNKKNARSEITTWFTHEHIEPTWKNIIQKNLALTSHVTYQLYEHRLQPSIVALEQHCKLEVPAGAQQTVQNWLNNNSIKKFILLAPNTTWISKHWPTPHWKTLIKNFITNSSYNVVLVGSTHGEQAKSLLAWITQKNIPVYNSPAWDLLTLSHLIQQASIVIAPDTGLLHLADFMKKPAIGLFGPTHAYKHGPFIVKDNIFFAQQATCYHYYKKQHGTQKTINEKNNCMYTLAPELVYNATVAYLAKNQHLKQHLLQGANI